MKRHPRWRAGDGWWIALATLLFAGVVRAEPWYEIEILVFRYADRAAEQWSAATQLPDVARGLRLDDAAAAGAPAVAGGGWAAYRALARHELELAGAAQVLARAGGFEPLIHAGWRQAASDGRAVYLSGGATQEVIAAHGAGLEGVARLVPGGTPRLAVDFVTYLDGVAVRMSARRPVRPGELHYFDHPLIGVLAQVTALGDPDSPSVSAVEAAPD